MRDELATVVGAQFLVYAIAWSGIALADRRRRIASGYWALYNLFQAASIALLARSATHGSSTLGVLSLLLAIGGYALPNAGVDRFLHDRTRYGWLWLLMALAGAVVAFNPGSWLSEPAALVLSLNGSAIAFSLVGVVLFCQPLRREFGWVGLAALLPSIAYGLVLLFKTILTFSSPAQVQAVGTQSASRLGLFLFVISIAGAVNMGFLGLYVSRLLIGIRRVATTDLLTGLMNRHETTKLLHAEWARHQRSGLPLSLAFIDVDHFKRINDLGGHQAGDYILQSTAALIQKALRGTDHAGRWGGEEFLLILPETPAQGASAVVMRLHQAIQRHAVNVPEGCPPLTISVGVACTVDVSTSMQPLDLVAQADKAMYQAKANGRNRTVVFSATDSAAPATS